MPPFPTVRPLVLRPDTLASVAWFVAPEFVGALRKEEEDVGIDLPVWCAWKNVGVCESKGNALGLEEEEEEEAKRGRRSFMMSEW